MKLENIKHILTNSDYAYYMHGTGRFDDSIQEEIIKSIFKKGLRASHRSLYYTSCCYGDGNYMRDNWDEVKHDMDNWKHLDSKNIIIVRVPIKYLILGADESLGEKDYAIYREESNGEDREDATRFVDNRLVVGCYNSRNGEFLMNPNFKEQLSSEDEKEFDARYEEGVEEFNRRISTVFEPGIGGSKQGKSKPETQDLEPIDQEILDSLWLDFE